MENFVWDWSALTDSYRIVAEHPAEVYVGEVEA
jgi:hypothetical protein